MFTLYSKILAQCKNPFYKLSIYFKRLFISGKNFIQIEKLIENDVCLIGRNL